MENQIKLHKAQLASDRKARLASPTSVITAFAASGRYYALPALCGVAPMVQEAAFHRDS